jgi:hypothetical protein
VKRRELTLGLLAIGIAIATHAGAQTGASPMPRVVIIATGDEAFFRPFRDRFLQGMRALGHAEGKTFRLDIRYTHGEPARSVTLIREALASRPEVLVVSGLTNARRAREATKTVPVVVATSSDIVDAGIVMSFCPARREHHWHHGPGRRSCRQAPRTPEGANPDVVPRRPAQQSRVPGYGEDREPRPRGSRATQYHSPAAVCQGSCLTYPGCRFSRKVASRCAADRR